MEKRVKMGLRLAWIKAVMQLMQLPIVTVIIMSFFTSPVYAHLKTLVVGRPWMEVFMYLTLSCFPLWLARSDYLTNQIASGAKKLASLMTMGKRTYTGSAHVLLAALKPLQLVSQQILLFFAINLATNAVPQNALLKVPYLMRGLDQDNDGFIPSQELVDWVYEVSLNVLKGLLAWAVCSFILAAKKPPRNFHKAGEPSGKSAISRFVQSYWDLVGDQFGWWTIVDWMVSVALLTFAIVPWLRLFNIDARPVLAVGGVGGLALSLAAQKLIGNMAAGLIILIARPFRIGDTIENGHLDIRFHCGVVQAISWNATTLLLDDGTEVFLPNSQLLDYPTKVIRKALPGTASLEVHLLRAFGLRDADEGGDPLDVSDPFAVASVGSMQFRTETVMDNLDPEWQSPCFQFEVGPEHDMLHIQVWDEDLIGSDDNLGDFKLDFRTLEPGEWEKRRDVLEDGEGAEIEYMVRYTP